MKKIKNNSEKHKESILRWATKNGRLPSRKSEKVIERRYGQRMENYLSIKNPCFDPEFRDLIYSKFDRKVNNKREHNKALRINELLTFLKENNRTPSIVIKEERNLCSILCNYTRPASPLYNSKLERQVFGIDKCFRTLIPKKYRKCINNALQETDTKLKEENF